MHSKRPSYSQPDPVNLHPEIDIHPRPLAPLKPLPTNVSQPPLPSPVRNPSFTSSYTLTTHLFPSAYPHAPSSLLLRSEYTDNPGETKDLRLKRQERLVHDLWIKNKAQTKGQVREMRKAAMWNAVNRFVRNDVGKGESGLTLLLAHANGFHKEIWEPFLQHVFARAKYTNIIIDEVWAFDSIQHGDSALLNEHVLGDVFDWADNARDIVNVLTHYLPCCASTAVLPTHLPRIPDAIAKYRQMLGFKSRTLVGIGHSLGGCSSLRAAISYPALFASLILVDPVILPHWAVSLDKIPKLAEGAVKRRANWASRGEALLSFRKSPFFETWDPAVLEKYVEHGLGPDPDGGSKDAVRLKMSGAQEAIVFLDRRVCFETWQLMPGLDKRIELRFIMNGKDNLTTGGEDATREMVWRCHNSSNVRIPCAGHLVRRPNPPFHMAAESARQIPQEAPELLAEEVLLFLERKYKLKTRL